MSGFDRIPAAGSYRGAAGKQVYETRPLPGAFTNAAINAYVQVLGSNSGVSGAWGSDVTVSAATDQTQNYLLVGMSYTATQPSVQLSLKANSIVVMDYVINSLISTATSIMFPMPIYIAAGTALSAAVRSTSSSQPTVSLTLMLVPTASLETY